MRARDTVGDQGYRESYPSDVFVHLRDNIGIVEDPGSSYGREGGDVALEGVERVDGVLIRLC